MIISIQIKPVSDLQNDFNSIENSVLNEGETIYLTKNGYGAMVMMSLNEFSKLTERSKDVFSQEMDTNKRSGHIEIISKPKKVTDEDD